MKGLNELWLFSPFFLGRCPARGQPRGLLAWGRFGAAATVVAAVAVAVAEVVAVQGGEGGFRRPRAAASASAVAEAVFPKEGTPFFAESRLLRVEPAS